MAQIFIIAGPPGIGKSSAGYYFIPENLIILDPDQIANRYKIQGFSDYKDIGHIKFNELLKKELFKGNDFAIELNLGFQSHYDFIKSVKSFNSDNTIDVVLFHTDDIDLCFQRAKIRHQSGLHLVDPDTIREMYQNTIPLLLANFPLISSLLAINVSAEDLPKICLEYRKAEKQLVIVNQQPGWSNSALKAFLKAQVK